MSQDPTKVDASGLSAVNCSRQSECVVHLIWQAHISTPWCKGHYQWAARRRPPSAGPTALPRFSPQAMPGRISEPPTGRGSHSSDRVAITMKAELTKSRPRRVAAGTLAAATALMYCVYPDAFWTVSEGLSIHQALFLPLFVLGVVAVLLLDFSTDSRVLRLALKVVASLGCLLVILYASEVLSGRHFAGLLEDNPFAFFFEYSIILAICMVSFALTCSVPWSLRITAVIIAIYGFVSFYTIMFRGTPFIPQDIFGLSTAANVASSYYLTFTKEVFESLLAFACVFLLAPRLKFARPPKRRRWLVRGVALALPCLFLFTTVSKPFIVANGLEPFYWSQSQSSYENGSLVNFVANIADATVEAPEGYSVEAVNDIAAAYVSDSAASASERPDVIVVLGESWADIVPEGHAATNEPVTPFVSGFRDRDDTAYGSLIVSSKGGGTSRQEFQFLTGSNDEYGLHSAPFQFLVDERLPTIVSSFKSMDYQTVAIHNGTSGAWTRDTALPAMGFDSFISAEDLSNENAPHLREYLRDSVVYDEALEILDSADESTFLYVITIQTHGGYGHESFESTIHLEEPEGSYEQTEQYLSVLNEADSDFEDFVKALEGRERPTLVLFFGDHLPNFENSYDEDVLENSGDPLWRYRTFYGVWANYGLPETSLDDCPALSLSYLNLYLIQCAGLPMTGYQKFLLEGAEQYPVSSIVGYMETDGTLMSVDEAKETDLYKEQAIIQYNYIYDRANMPEGFYTLQG